MKRLAISPCPNDTFAFYGLLHGRVSYGEELETRLEDIEALNQLFFRAEADFCKISFHAYLHGQSTYQILEAGSALGRGCGPILVASRPLSFPQLGKARIAIPGRYTTAALLLRLWLGDSAELVEMRFDQILPTVARGDLDAGLIIHESRFTYPDYGLVQLQDLGDWWEKETGLPIPLGGIAAKRSLGERAIAAFDQALAASIAYAQANPSEPVAFMRAHAQEMDEQVMRAHVALYVNSFTLGLGPEGHAAIATLARMSQRLRL